MNEIRCIRGGLGGRDSSDMRDWIDRVRLWGLWRHVQRKHAGKSRYGKVTVSYRTLRMLHDQAHTDRPEQP